MCHVLTKELANKELALTQLFCQKKEKGGQLYTVQWKKTDLF